MNSAKNISLSIFHWANANTDTNTNMMLTIIENQTHIKHVNNLIWI